MRGQVPFRDLGPKLQIPLQVSQQRNGVPPRDRQVRFRIEKFRGIRRVPRDVEGFV